MKGKYSFVLFILLLSLPLLHHQGCSTDPTSPPVGNPPLFGGYHQDDAGIMMTLSAFCYLASNSTNAIEIRDSISAHLQNTSYATGGNWKVSWGPGLSPSGGNLVYVAVDSTADSISYAICARGTIMEISNIFEDLEVYHLAKWPFSGTSDSVAVGSLEALDTILSTTDPTTGQTLQAYLTTLTAEKQKMYITGHSLGGAIATMLTSWFVDMGFTSHFRLSSYTFAAPTVGNPSFVQSYHNKMLASGSISHRCVNSKDAAPFFWGNMRSLITNNIPTYVPPLINAAIVTIEQYFHDSGIVYKQVETLQDLGTIDPTYCPNDSSLSNYQCWVSFEHTTNTYLKLLNVDTVIWSRKRPDIIFNLK